MRAKKKKVPWESISHSILEQDAVLEKALQEMSHDPLPFTDE